MVTVDIVLLCTEDATDTERCAAEGRHGIGGIDAPHPARHIQTHGMVGIGRNQQRIGHAYRDGGGGKIFAQGVGDIPGQGPVNDGSANGGQCVISLRYTFEHHRNLMLAGDKQCSLGDYRDGRDTVHACRNDAAQAVGIRDGTAAARRNAQGRIQYGHIGGSQVAKAIEDGQHHHHSGYGHGNTGHRHKGDDIDRIVRVSCPQVAKSYTQHRHRCHDVSVVGLGCVHADSVVRCPVVYAVGGEKSVDILGIVQRIVHEECQLRRFTQLIAHALRQFVAYGLGRGIDALDDFGRALGRENRQISASHRQIGANAYSADTHQRTMSLGCLQAEQFAELLL